MNNHFFKKSLGQNFLKYKGIATDLINTIDFSKIEEIIEIGPGRGVITQQLVTLGKNPIVIERDDNLIPYLEETFGKKITLLHKDVLDVDFEKLTKNKRYSVIGSLPYNISKEIIRIFLTADNKPEQMSFIIQREVAQSYCAKPPKASLLSNFASLHSNVKTGKVISSKAFFPQPKVDGQIIIFQEISEKFEENKNIWKILRQGFSKPRKVLSSNLSDYNKHDVEKILEELKLSTKARASELSIQDWNNLISRLND